MIRVVYVCGQCNSYDVRRSACAGGTNGGGPNQSHPPCSRDEVEVVTVAHIVEALQDTPAIGMSEPEAVNWVADLDARRP